MKLFLHRPPTAECKLRAHEETQLSFRSHNPPSLRCLVPFLAFCSATEPACEMDITHSVVSERGRALLGGDYDAYHSQATRKIHHLRRRLGTANRGRKYTPKSPVTAENVAKNPE